jgi:hypothetical protein
MLTRVPAWFDRKFEFTFPVEQFPNLCVRLRGTPARLEETVRGVGRDALIAKEDDGWSAQEHAGHLMDLEPLWKSRVDDFLRGGDTLTTADLTNRRTHEANHNARAIGDILAGFRSARTRLVKELEHLPREVFSGSMLHPRLKQPMRLVDHLFFVAEHDDHHLARIWEMIQR